MAKPTLIRRNTDQAAMRDALGSTPASQTATTPPVLTPVTKDNHDAESYIVGQTYAVPLFKLQKSENNARYFYRADELDEMTTSLQKSGQDVPAIGYLKDGRVVLVDGQKRFHAATSGGLSTLDICFIAPPESDRAEYLASRRINLNRSNQGAFDDAVRWQSLLDKGVFQNLEELAKDVELSVPSVSRITKLNRIPERLMRSMNEDQQTRAASIAYEISQIFALDMFKDSQDQAEHFAEEVIRLTKDKQLNRDQVIALIKEKAQGPKTRERADSEVVKYGETRGTLKVFLSRGQIDLSFKGLPQAKVVELRELIEQMLEGQLSI